jgi:hypothetical protein
MRMNNSTIDKALSVLGHAEFFEPACLYGSPATVRARLRPNRRGAHTQLVAEVDNLRHRAEVDNAGHGRDY